MVEYKLFTMFAGYGTDNFALKRLGIDYECIGFSEIDKYAIQCFQQNHSGKNYGDCREINPKELPDFDILTGGFPCQAFSNAGKGLGELDPRGTLFYEIIRIAEVKKPKYMLLENVKGLTSKKFKETFNKILSELDRIDYNVKWKVLNSKDYGIPQNRERVWFVCLRKDIEQEYQFPKTLIDKPNHYVTKFSVPQIGQAERIYDSNGISLTLNVGWVPLIKEVKTVKKYTLNDILETDVDEKYYLSEKQIVTLQKRFKEKGKELNLNENLYLSCALRTRDNVKQLEIRKDKVANSITTHQYDSMLVQITNASPREVGFKDITPTLLSRDYKEPKIVKTNILRKLTPKECFRLMGFVNDEINLEGLSDTQKYKLAGNGQDVNVVSLIFKNLLIDKTIPTEEQTKL